MVGNLPPGVTPSDIDKHFGPPECSCCHNTISYDNDHKLGCPKHPDTDYCSVCNPPPKMYHPCLPSLPVFCDRHDHEDYEKINAGMENPTLDDLIDQYKREQNG